MNALMVALVIALMATPGGRWWWLARGEPAALVILSAVLACAAGAIGGQWVAAAVRGPGMQLLLALAILFAGGGLLWPTRRTPTGCCSRSWSLIRLVAAAWGDAAPFVVFAAAAWARESLLAALGGAAGMVATVALAHVLTRETDVPPWLGWLRMGTGVVLLIVGVVVALLAMGLL